MKGLKLNQKYKHRLRSLDNHACTLPGGLVSWISLSANNVVAFKRTPAFAAATECEGKIAKTYKSLGKAPPSAPPARVRNGAGGRRSHPRILRLIKMMKSRYFLFLFECACMVPEIADVDEPTAAPSPPGPGAALRAAWARMDDPRSVQAPYHGRPECKACLDG